MNNYKRQRLNIIGQSQSTGEPKTWRKDSDDRRKSRTIWKINLGLELNKRFKAKLIRGDKPGKKNIDHSSKRPTNCKQEIRGRLRKPN